MTTMASQITSLTVVYTTVYSDADKKKTSKLRVTGLCAGNSPGPVNSPHKGPVTRKMFPFDDVIMNALRLDNAYPDSKVHGANMGPIWGRQDPGGPHVGPMNLPIWVYITVKWLIIDTGYNLSPVRRQPII